MGCPCLFKSPESDASNLAHPSADSPKPWTKEKILVLPKLVANNGFEDETFLEQARIA